MIFTKPSSVAVVIGLMASFLAVPSVGSAGPFDCLFPSAVVSPAPTTVQRISWMPAVGNQSVCDPCGQQVALVPETKRRWTYSRIPKTTFKPVTTCDPCTGCPVTTYRPLTTYSLLPWLHRETYTTYNRVSAPLTSYNQCCAPTTCNPCGGVSSFSYAGGTSGCSTCASGSTQPSIISSPSDSIQPQTDPGYTPRKTYFDGQKPSQMQGPGAGNDIKPEPDIIPNKNTSIELPELNGHRGRTAARLIKPLGEVRTVSWELSAAPASPSQPVSRPKLDVSGWHAVTD